MEYISLNLLPKNEKLYVTQITAKGISRRRLNDLGIATGSIIENIFSPPWNEPTAYSIKGTTIALRAETAQQIYGFKLQKAEEWFNGKFNYCSRRQS